VKIFLRRGQEHVSDMVFAEDEWEGWLSVTEFKKKKVPR